MIGEKLREARLAQDRSLADVAAKAKISVATLSRIENDKQSVDVRLLVTLARVLEVAAPDLLRVPEEDTGGEPLARKIAAMDVKRREELWREVSAERRTLRTRGRGVELRQHVEELLAQVDLLREELDGIRKRIKKR
jgi:transcriptional regulator with XRE-family HTH domain